MRRELRAVKRRKLTLINHMRNKRWKINIFWRSTWFWRIKERNSNFQI